MENKIPDLLKEIERQAEAAEQARIEHERQHREFLAAQEREKAERRAKWETAMAKARASATEAHRRRTFGEALEA